MKPELVFELPNGVHIWKASSFTKGKTCSIFYNHGEDSYRVPKSFLAFLRKNDILLIGNKLVLKINFVRLGVDQLMEADCIKYANKDSYGLSALTEEQKQKLIEANESISVCIPF